MPELPEVETIRRGLAPQVEERTIAGIVLRAPGLRWPFPPGLGSVLAGQQVLAVGRRAKYLLLRCTSGHLLLHLGMTGHLRVVPADTPPLKHDHVDLLFTDGTALRFNDARRFGALLWTPGDPSLHPLLVELGPEPFAIELDGDYLFRRSRGRRSAVKTFIMDQTVMVGVGNIYASEVLFRAGIHPEKAAGAIAADRYEHLVEAIREVLDAAIAAGGTTIRDFASADGNPGYFSRELQVYGREGEPCSRCGRRIRAVRLGGRSTFFCPKCQK